MSRAYIFCLNCDNTDYCYCFDQDLEVRYVWGFEPANKVIYPPNIVYSSIGVDKDGYCKFWFHTHKSFDPSNSPVLFVRHKKHPLADKNLSCLGSRGSYFVSKSYVNT